MALKELDATPELRDDPSLKDFNDISTLAKSFRDTKAFVGNSIRPPGPDASPEAKKDFLEKLQKHAPELVLVRDGDADSENMMWGKLGRPAKPEDYVFEQPKDGPVIDLEALRAVAVETGMTKKQFAKAAARTLALAQKTAADTDADAKALKAEWGQAHDQNLAKAAEASAKAGAPEAFVKAVREGKLPSSQLKLWLGIAKSVGAEGTIIGKQDGAPNGAALTPAEAEAQIDEIMHNPLYFDRNGGAARERLLLKVVELQQYVTPKA